MKEVKMFNGDVLKVGDEVRFVHIYSDGDEEELLESGEIWVANDESDIPIIADFEILRKDKEDLLNSLVKITGIY